MNLVEQAWRTQDELAAIDRQLADLRQGAITVSEEGGETGERKRGVSGKTRKPWKSTLSERVKSWYCSFTILNPER